MAAGDGRARDPSPWANLSLFIDDRNDGGADLRADVGGSVRTGRPIPGSGPEGEGESMKQNSQKTVKGEYVLATGGAAAHRLQVLHKLYGPGARRALLQAGSQPARPVADLRRGVGPAAALDAALSSCTRRH